MGFNSGFKGLNDTMWKGISQCESGRISTSCKIQAQWPYGLWDPPGLRSNGCQGLYPRM